MAGSTKKRQQLSSGSRTADLSHMTRPKLDPLVQQTLESVGMRTRKALSDSMFRKEQAQPAALQATKLAILSSQEIRKPRPYYETNAARDPWASFRAAGRTGNGVCEARVSKRVRESEDDSGQEKQFLFKYPASLETDLINPGDPNDMEFTNPPWLASQESLQSDDEMHD